MPTILRVHDVETLAYPEGYEADADETAAVGNSDFAVKANTTNVMLDDGITVCVVHGDWSEEEDWKDRTFTSRTKNRDEIKTEVQAAHAVVLAAKRPADTWEGKDIGAI